MNILIEGNYILIGYLFLGGGGGLLDKICQVSGLNALVYSKISLHQTLSSNKFYYLNF